MRRIITIIVAALMLASCSTLRAPARLDRFVDRTERRADRYTTRDWQISQDRYNALLQEYIDNYKMFTREEKKLAMSAIGRYHGLLVDYGIKSTINVADQLKAYAGGLKDILTQDANAVTDFLRDVLGMGKNEINSTIKKLKE